MGDKLPDLNGRETRALLDHFTTSWEHARGGGSKVTGSGRRGRFSLDIEHNTGGIRRDYLKRVLNVIGVSREEFFAWYERR